MMNAKSLKLRLRGGGKNLAWMTAGAVLVLAITVSAQQSGTTGATTQPCDPNGQLGQAMSNALNNNIALIGMTQPDPTKYFAKGGSSSFICGLSISNLDLSGLIPDLMGLLSQAATQALNAAVNKACAAVQRDFGQTINQYNTAINTVNGVTNGTTINTAVGSEVNRAIGQYSTSYNSPTTSPIVTAGVANSQILNGTLPVNVPVTPPTTPVATPPTSTTAVTPATPSAQQKSSVLGCLFGGC